MTTGLRINILTAVANGLSLPHTVSNMTSYAIDDLMCEKFLDLHILSGDEYLAMNYILCDI